MVMFFHSSLCRTDEPKLGLNDNSVEEFNMLFYDQCGDCTVESKKCLFPALHVPYLWLPSVTVGTMVMFSSGLKRGHREPYHVLTSVSLTKPTHSTQQEDEAFFSLQQTAKYRENCSSFRITYCSRLNNAPPSALQC